MIAAALALSLSWVPPVLPPVTLAAGQAADLVSTIRAFDRGCVEANGLYGSGRPPVAQLAIVKGSATVGAVLAMRLLRARHHERLAALFGYTGAGVGFGAAVHNLTIRCGRE
jgi:hypothetical protein